MTNDKAQTSNEAQNPNDKKKYDLEARTAQFGEAIIDFVRTLPYDPVNSPLIGQIVRAATSIGANYMEADGVNLGRISNTRSPSAKKSQRKQNIG